MSKPVTISVNSRTASQTKRLSVAVPLEVLRESNLTPGDRVNVRFEDNRMRIFKASESVRTLADVYQPANIKNVAFININAVPVGFSNVEECPKIEITHSGDKDGLVLDLPVEWMNIRKKSIETQSPPDAHNVRTPRSPYSSGSNRAVVTHESSTQAFMQEMRRQEKLPETQPSRRASKKPARSQGKNAGLGDRTRSARRSDSFYRTSNKTAA